MEKHYMVWSTLIIFMITVSFCVWFFRYVETLKRENPARANLAQLLFCLAMVVVSVAIHLFVDDANLYSSTLRQVATLGIIGSGILCLLFGGLYFARKSECED